MSLSREEVEKIYSLREKLLITYKAATSNEIKKSMRLNINELDKIISDIEEGHSIDPAKLNLFSKFLNKPKKSDTSSYHHDEDEFERINYAAKVERIKISDKNKDSEMDEIYSFLKYLEKNFIIPLGQTYLKLDYYLSKKRDTVFNHFDGLKHLMKEYIDDIDVLYSLRFDDQIEQYNSRLGQQKKYFLIKVSEILRELKDFINEMLSDYNSGRNSIFNSSEKFAPKFNLADKTDFDGVDYITIINEFKLFIDDFIAILRMPKFK